MKWYHVTRVNRGKEYLFIPVIPYRLQKGEDKRTERIYVTSNWRCSLRSIILIHLNRYFYVYSSEEKPVNPQEIRKRVSGRSNDYRLPNDGIVNREHWYLKEVRMRLEGYVRIPEEMYAMALMGMGMFNDPDVDKLKIIEGEVNYDEFY